MCRSDAPRSIMICRRSCIVAAIESPFPGLRQGNPENFLDGGGAVDALEEAGVAEGPHALALGALAEPRADGAAEGEVAPLGGCRHAVGTAEAAPPAGALGGESA